MKLNKQTNFFLIFYPYRLVYLHTVFLNGIQSICKWNICYCSCLIVRKSVSVWVPPDVCLVSRALDRSELWLDYFKLSSLFILQKPIFFFSFYACWVQGARTCKHVLCSYHYCLKHYSEKKLVVPGICWRKSDVWCVSRETGNIYKNRANSLSATGQWLVLLLPSVCETL